MRFAEKMKLEQTGFQIFGESNVGLCRSRNEDTFLIHRSADGCAFLAAVADGVGGHALGHVASYLCCRELLSESCRFPGEAWGAELLKNALNRANRIIFERNFREERLRPSSTSIVAAVFSPQGISIVNVGDSRFYEYNAEKRPALQQLSVDHKPDRQTILMLKRKHLLPAEFQRGSMILRSIGSRCEVEIEEKHLEWQSNSRYLLCSDGCYGMIPQITIENTLSAGQSAREMTGALMRGVLLAGAKDNVSVITAMTGEVQ